jgi:hypothetical protein
MSLSSILEAPAWVASAIKKASQSTGADFDYLLKTAARESAFDQDAKASTSSASGLFQFIENTWLGMIKDVGPQMGLTDYASAIQQTKSGRSYVPDAQARAEILNLRNDPEISAMVAGVFTQQNASYLSDRLGRQPTEGELYIAHFLGAGNGARFIRLAETRPDLPANVYFGRAARANRSIFYADGKARTMGEVYETLVSKYGNTPVAVAAAPAAPTLPARKPDAAAASPTGPLVATKVASLVDMTPRFESAKVLDAGVGSIGQWHTLVLPAGADVTSAVKAASHTLDAAKTGGANPAAGVTKSAKADAESATRNDVGDALIRAPRASAHHQAPPPTRVADSRPFSETFWETRLANH